MKKELCYAVLGNANIAADGRKAAVATAWLHGPVHYHREYTVEIPDTILENPEKYVKAHPSGEEFIKNILFAHNPSFSLPNSLKGWKGTELEYSSTYKMFRILRRFENLGLFIDCKEEKKMANDWSGVDKPEYIPDTETDAGDYIRMEYEREKILIKKAKEVLSNGRDSGD